MNIRVRFAPSPTGFMHLGNVRASLFNYLFARQKKGTFILRIEDTDASRNLDEAKLRILQDLEWLDLHYQEGPVKGGAYGPYSQSERASLYQEHLDELIDSCRVYRCFCSHQDLEVKRAKQQAMGKPPRYDRTCLGYSDDKIKLKLTAGIPFVWRFKVNENQIIEINDMARKKVTFEMKHFSDFAITRADGTCTFIFANFIDDWLMKITHVIRGEDHLTNTAQQAALYDAFALPLPVFWHLPMICNAEGTKLSKRDFGFSLQDLILAGFLPEAVCNYMATAGGSFAQEIQSLEELAKNFNFDHLHASGPIRYDLEKLTWFNHKWINKVELEKLVHYTKPLLHAEIPASTALSDEQLAALLGKIRADVKTLKDAAEMLRFYFDTPQTNLEKIESELGQEKAEIVLTIIKNNIAHLENADLFINGIKAEALSQGLKIKEMFGPLRYLLTGSFQGMGIHDLFGILSKEQISDRLSKLV